MPNNTTTLIAELNALLRMTATETVIAEARRAQAGSEDIEQELARNADHSRERARLITDAIRELGGLPNVVAATAGRLGAMAKLQLDQGADLAQALLGDLALEQQLHARARFVKVLAEAAGQRTVARLAERLERAHAETIAWLEIRLAEVGVGGPPALRPTPVQTAVGVARKAAALPVRGAAAGINRSADVLRTVGRSAARTVEEQLDRGSEIWEAAKDVTTAGRNASLERAEQEARDEGATRTARALRSARGAMGGLNASELPIAGYDDLKVAEAVQRIDELTDAADVRAILAYEEAHAARARVVSAATARLGAVAREALEGDDAAARSKARTSTRTGKASSSGGSQRRAQRGSKPRSRRERLGDLTVTELREQASREDIDGRSGMSKDELVGALAKT